MSSCSLFRCNMVDIRPGNAKTTFFFRPAALTTAVCIDRIEVVGERGVTEVEVTSCSNGIPKALVGLISCNSQSSVELDVQPFL